MDFSTLSVKIDSYSIYNEYFTVMAIPSTEASRVEDKKTEAIKLMQLLESCRLKET
jgi:hypothetical protein